MNSKPTGIDPIFSNPRLAAVYNAFDPDRSDLPPYIKIIDDLHAKKVVDLGCGTGALPLLLLENNVQATTAASNKKNL